MVCKRWSMPRRARRTHQASVVDGAAAFDRGEDLPCEQVARRGRHGATMELTLHAAMVRWWWSSLSMRWSLERRLDSLPLRCAAAQAEAALPG
jgi:hypothetical protein